MKLLEQCNCALLIFCTNIVFFTCCYNYMVRKVGCLILPNSCFTSWIKTLLEHYRIHKLCSIIFWLDIRSMKYLYCNCWLYKFIKMQIFRYVVISLTISVWLLNLVESAHCNYHADHQRYLTLILINCTCSFCTVIRI